MQGNASIPKQVRLIAVAGDPTIEIYISDGHFKHVAKAYGQIDVKLPPGIYKVKFAAGSLNHEVYVTLEPHHDVVEVTPPDLPFSTSAPIKKTRTSHNHHEDNASQLSKTVHCHRGTGSQLFVFVRDLARQGWDDPASGLTLHDLAGNLLLDFTKAGERDITHAETGYWAGCTVQLDPGSYRLRVRTATAETLEQMIFLCSGWQTQVFCLRRLYGNKLPLLGADLGHTSVFMVPLGRGFQPESTAFKQAELTRQGLVRHRAVLEARELGKMNWARDGNPMLGIYGAHLHLLSPQPDKALLRDVIKTLQTLIGTHPDVTALAVWLDERTMDSPVYQAPPLLRSSWKIIVNASIAHPEIVPAGSLVTHIAGRIWGEGAWLTWHELSTGALPQTIKPLDISALRAVLVQIVALLTNTSSREPIVEIASTHALSNLERFLLEYVAMAAYPKQSVPFASEVFTRTDEEHLEAWGRTHLTDATLVKALGVPHAAISEAIGGLIQKMELHYSGA